MGRIDGDAEKVRRYGEFRYAAASWTVGALGSGLDGARRSRCPRPSPGQALG